MFCLGMYPSVEHGHPRFLKSKNLGLLGENTNIFVFRILKSSVEWHVYMVANRASSDFAHDLRRFLNIANPPWSIGANVIEKS